MKDTVVFDIETKKSFDDVGGRDHMDLLGISVLCAYSYNKDAYFAFEEHEVAGFKKMLDEAGTLIGFNIKGFDIPVMEPYIPAASYNVAVLDLMDDVVRGAGFRISLDNLAGTTLGVKKSADGLQALQWYKEGKIDESKKYCTQDVRVTKELYEHGKAHGNILFFSRDQMRKTAIPVSWGGAVQKDVSSILREALAERRSVEIDYVTGTASSSADEPRNIRLVDVYKLNKEVFEGYCHLRRAPRIFKIDRVLSAKITPNPYVIKEDVQDALF